MTACLPQHLTGDRAWLPRAIVTIALPVVLFGGASDAGATSLVAAHAPGGAINVAIVQGGSSQIATVSRSVGLMTGASGDVNQSELGASRTVTRSVGLMEGAAGTNGQAELASSPMVSRSVGLMEGAHR